MVDADENTGKYPISVVARLTGVPEHRLRAFETAGLIEPERTEGGTRLYSDTEVGLVVHIAELSDKGVNYAGIREVLDLEALVQTEASDENADGEENEEGTE